MTIKKFFIETSWIVFFIIILALLKTTVISFYLIPSMSMFPNVIPGDRVLTNRLAYGLWLPFANSSIVTWNSPKRGDIILFKLPDEEGTFIKRVIGIEGDTVSFHEGKISINTIPLDFKPVYSSEKVEGFNEYMEQSELLDLKKHFVLMSENPDRTYFESRRFVVPPKHVFVLGDNRDNSNDGRSFGFVREAFIYGRTSFILFSTFGEIGILPKFNSGRFLKNID